MSEQAQPVDPLTQFRTSVREIETQLTDARRERDEQKALAEGLQAEKDMDWKTVLDEAAKLVPGMDTPLLKMLAVATRPEFEQMQTFLALFDGRMPVGLVRLTEGINALLNGIDTTVSTEKPAT